MPHSGSVVQGREACEGTEEESVSAVSGAAKGSPFPMAGLAAFVALRLLDGPTQESGGDEETGGVLERGAECEHQPGKVQAVLQETALRTPKTSTLAEGLPEEAQLLQNGPAVGDGRAEGGTEGEEGEGGRSQEPAEEESRGKHPIKSDLPCEIGADAPSQGVLSEQWRVPFSQRLTQAEAGESWDLGRGEYSEKAVLAGERQKGGVAAAAVAKESKAVGAGAGMGAVRMAECCKMTLTLELSERNQAGGGEAENDGVMSEGGGHLTGDGRAGGPEKSKSCGETMQVGFDLGLDLRMSLVETQDRAASPPALEEEENAEGGGTGMEGCCRANADGDVGGQPCQRDAGRDSKELSGPLEQPFGVRLGTANENGPPLPERAPDGQVLPGNDSSPRPLPEAADVTVAATPEPVEGEQTPIRCSNQEGKVIEGGSALAGGEDLEGGVEPGPITSARRAVGMAVTSSEVMLIERFLAGEDLSGTGEKNPFQLAYVGGVKIRLKRRSLGLDEFRLGGVASETETEGEEDLLADLQTQAAAEGTGEGVGEQGGVGQESGAGEQTEEATTGEVDERGGVLRESREEGAEERGGEEEGGGGCLKEAAGKGDEGISERGEGVCRNGVDGAEGSERGGPRSREVQGVKLEAGVSGRGVIVGQGEETAKRSLDLGSPERRENKSSSGVERGAGGVEDSPKTMEGCPKTDGPSGQEELDTQVGLATQKALARARAMLRGWTGPAAASPQPPTDTAPVPPPLDTQTVAANTCPGIPPDHETRGQEERTTEVGKYSEQSHELVGSAGHVAEEELRFSCGGPETQLALARGRAVVRKWAPGLVSPVSCKGAGAERNEEGVEGASEDVAARQEQNEEGGGAPEETSRRQGDGSGDPAANESETRLREEGERGDQKVGHPAGKRAQLEAREDPGPARDELGKAEETEQQSGLAKGRPVETLECLDGAHEKGVSSAVEEVLNQAREEAAEGSADCVSREAKGSAVADRKVDLAEIPNAEGSESVVRQDMPDASEVVRGDEMHDPQPLPAVGGDLPDGHVALTSASRAEPPQQGGSIVGNGQTEEAEAKLLEAEGERGDPQTAGTPPDGLGFTTPPAILGPFWAPEGGFPLGSTAPPSSRKRPCPSWRVSETQNPDETPVRNGAAGERVESAGSPEEDVAGSREGGTAGNEGFAQLGAGVVDGLRTGSGSGLEGLAASNADGVGAGVAAEEGVIGRPKEATKPYESKAAADKNGWRQKVTEARAPPEGMRGPGQTAPKRGEGCPEPLGDPPAGKVQRNEGVAGPQPGTNEKAPRGSPKGAGWTQCLEYFQQQVEMGRVCTLPAYSPGGCDPGAKTGGVAGWAESEPSPGKHAQKRKAKVTAGGAKKSGEGLVTGGQKSRPEPGRVEEKECFQGVGCGLGGRYEETGSMTVDDDAAGGWREAVRAQEKRAAEGVSALEKKETRADGCREEKAGVKQAPSSPPQREASSPGGHGVQRSCSQSGTPWPEICSVIGSEELPLFKPKPRVVYSAAHKPAAEGGSAQDKEEGGGGGERKFVEVETQESVGVLIWQRRTGVKRARTFVIDSTSEGREAERGGIHNAGEEAVPGEGAPCGNGARKRLRKIGGGVLDDIEEEATWHRVEPATWHEVEERKGGGGTKGIEAIASRWLGGWTPAAAPAVKHVADLPSTPPQTPPRESPPTATQQSAQHEKSGKLDRDEPPEARQPAWKRDGFVESLSQPSQADFPPCASDEIPGDKPSSAELKSAAAPSNPPRPSDPAKPSNPANPANPAKTLNPERPAEAGPKAPELVLEESPVGESPEMEPVKADEVRRSPRKKGQEGRPGEAMAGGWRNREKHVGGRKEAGGGRRETPGGRKDIVGGRKEFAGGRKDVVGGSREPPGIPEVDKRFRGEGAGAGRDSGGGREKVSNIWANPSRRPLSQAQKGRVTFVRPQRHDFVRNSSQAVADVARRMREVTQRAARENSASAKTLREKRARGKEASASDGRRTRSGRPNKRPMDSQFLVYGEGRAASSRCEKQTGSRETGAEKNGFSELPFEGTGQTEGSDSDDFGEEQAGEAGDLRGGERGDAGVTSGGLKWPEDRKRKRLPGSQESREKRPKGGDAEGKEGREKGHVAAGKTTRYGHRNREKAAGKRSAGKGKGKASGFSGGVGKMSDDGAAKTEEGVPESEGFGLRRRMRRKCFSKYKRAQKVTRRESEKPSEKARGGVTTRHGAALTKGLRLRKGSKVLRSNAEGTRGKLKKRATAGSKAAPEGPTEAERPGRRTAVDTEAAEASAEGSDDVRGKSDDVSGDEGKTASPKRAPGRRVSFQAVSPASPARRSSAFGTQQAAAAIFEMAGADVVDDVSGSPAAKGGGAATPRRSPRGKKVAGKPVSGEKDWSGGVRRKDDEEVREGVRKRGDAEPDVIDLRGNGGREKKAGRRGPILSSCRQNPTSSERGAKKRKLSDIGTGGDASEGCHMAKSARSQSPAARKGKRVKSDIELSEEDGEPVPSGPLFAGCRFLLTGLETGQKEKLTALLTQHGGQIFADIPEPPSRGANLGADHTPSPLKPRRRHAPGQPEATIVIAGRPVRTPKFLYGCAVGSWPVRSAWVSACVKAGTLVSRAKFESPRTETSAKNGTEKFVEEGKASGGGKKRGSAGVSGRNQAEERNGKELEQGVLAGLHLHLHGSARFKKTWADLVRHAGGHVCRSLEHDWAHAVLLEPGVDAPPDLKRAARRAKVSIKTLDWAVDALLSGSRPADFPNPPNPQTLEQALSPSGAARRDQDSPKHPPKRRKSSLASSDELLRKGKDPEEAGEPDHAPRNVREETPPEGGAAWEGLGLREPPPLPPDALTAPGESDVRPAKRTYFSVVTSAGERYRIGDAAETQADGSASARVVQLMSLWELPGNGGEGCMRATCRLFMRPQETEFPIGGMSGLGANQGLAESGLQEVYLSSVVQELDVSELRRKVHVARSTGGAGPSAGFLCRFFYDAEREILQKLKG
ncbi:hypothetical protein KFL_001850270 [Klebsormidium nitens]|uniref:Uncharacterized protein n=1 Tax=Klebsormidium nitens TaxID=105231 RepID=A0A1Y1I1K3_KLENI|nr:hypothetical protein KFL_001850270 [Klebsormidium nitens]|eukprot:GAQ84353.1 hypothetical protein KFL_001850270 [Klebsormidium nitens]